MSALERGRIVAGRYRLERALAQGGMGCVWVARHVQLETDVAIKFMTPQLAASPDACARFEREAKASAALRLANAVQIHDYGVEDGAPFLVMELLEGEDLQARLRREGRLGLPVTLGILGQVGRALRRAHEVGLVHRDLKPGNIFLAREGGEEVVKLLDFGIAKDTQGAFGGAFGGGGAGVTGTAALLGSPHYMSPEQVRTTSRVDHRTDLWALGVITFHCVTGHLPFSGDEIGDVLVDVCTKPIPVASTLAPDVGPGLDAFFARALTRDPAGRFQSVDEFLQALAYAGGSAGAPVFVPTNPGPAPIDPPAGGGTLSASAHTRNEPARAAGGARAAIAVTAGIVVASLAGALLTFVLLSGRSNAPSASAGPTSGPSTAPTEAAVTPPLPSAAPPAPPSAPDPSASTGPAAPTSAPSAAPPSSPTAPPPAKGSPKTKPRGPANKKDDLLNHI
jgi:serine/threonine protein kinase